jgi:hypothetical protein
MSRYALVFHLDRQRALHRVSLPEGARLVRAILQCSDDDDVLGSFSLAGEVCGCGARDLGDILKVDGENRLRGHHIHFPRTLRGADRVVLEISCGNEPSLRPARPVLDHCWIDEAGGIHTISGDAPENAFGWDIRDGTDALPVSDHGLHGAIPLPLPEWYPDPVCSDVEWAAQNRRINNLLMRGEAT